MQPITIAILAMGGEGGGVLADWIVELAEHNGFLGQMTSVPGVAQRTGATIYYIELFPESASAGPGSLPVLALMPAPGQVDIVIASELMEAGRAVQRGLVTADRTTLIASTHRVYSMSEKLALGDGRVDSEQLLIACRAVARNFVAADFAAMAQASGSVISAVLFGALAGTGRLPFSRSQFEAAVRRAEVGVEASLRAFAAGFESAQQAHGDAPAVPGARAPAAVPNVGVRLQPLAQRIAQQFPAAAQATIVAGILRLADYQDIDYATEYVDRLAEIRDLDAAHGDGSFRLLDESARHLALWMSYEDTIRVADLKCRSTRFDRVSHEMTVAGTQILRINEFMHPRIEEIADTLPAAAGRWLLRTGWARSLVGRFASRGRVVQTSSLRGFALLYFVAGLRRFRRRSLRYAVEQQRITGWLDTILATGRTDYALATEIAQCQRLVKGYGDTHARGWRSFEQIMSVAPSLAGRADAAPMLERLQTAALADESGASLQAMLSGVQRTIRG